MTDRITEMPPLANGWSLHGKTGMAFPRLADGSFDEAHAWGWFVGWAVKGGKTVVFAQLIQDDRKVPGTAGVRARDAFLNALPVFLDTLAK
jgi:beta-lactamase class D